MAGINVENKEVISFICALFICVSIMFGGSIWRSRRQLREVRDQLELTTEQLTVAEDTNSELRAQIRGTREIVEELGCSTNRSLNTVQECLDLVREIREQVKKLEDSVLGRSSDSTSDGSSNNDIDNEVKEKTDVN